MSYPSLPPAQGPPDQGYPPPQDPQAPYPQPQSQPPPPNYQDSLASGVENMSIKPRAGTTALLTMFGQGNIIQLDSKASGRFLRIANGDVDALGERDDPQAKFIVHVKRPGVVALQNVDKTDAWLGFADDKLIGSGRGGPLCELLVGEVDGKLISLESISYPGQRVGFFEGGTPTKPSETDNSGDQARFVPFLVSESSPPTQPAQPHPPPAAAAVGAAVGGAVAGAAFLPPYQDPAGMPPPQQQPPQQGYPPASYPPQQGQYPPQQGQYPPQQGQYPPQQGQYPPQQGQYPPQQYQQPPQPALQGPQLPRGLDIMHSFFNGNIIQLICRGNGQPVQVLQGRISAPAHGNLSKTTTHWLVEIPQGGAPGVIMLRHSVSAGIYLSVQKGGNVGAGKRGDKFCLFRVRALPDNYCMFESVEKPGFFLNFMPNGNCGGVKTGTVQDNNAQFFIRIEKQLMGSPNPILMSAYGNPSMAQNMRSGYVVQLYLKSNRMHLGINRNGIVYSTAKEDDPLTHFVVKDRGMGIVGFETRKFQGFRLRMEKTQQQPQPTLKGKGIADLNADFRVLDLPDGTVQFESVTCGGSFIGISVANGLQTNLNVALLQIQKFGATENVTKTLLN